MIFRTTSHYREINGTEYLAGVLSLDSLKFLERKSGLDIVLAIRGPLLISEYIICSSSPIAHG